jgi:hypothetical protein
MNPSKKILMTAALVVAGMMLTAFAGDSKPNILLILANDPGYGDTGAYGATKVKTPQIDNFKHFEIRRNSSRDLTRFISAGAGRLRAFPRFGNS